VASCSTRTALDGVTTKYNNNMAATIYHRLQTGRDTVPSGPGTSRGCRMGHVKDLGENVQPPPDKRKSDSTKIPSFHAGCRALEFGAAGNGNQRLISKRCMNCMNADLQIKHRTLLTTHSLYSWLQSRSDKHRTLLTTHSPYSWQQSRSDKHRTLLTTHLLHSWQ
jgi:hypothetical protein